MLEFFEMFFNFAKEHPFLAWCFAWGIWVIPQIFVIPFNFILKMQNRRLRATNIKIHGWPKNKNMDADGDIVYPKNLNQKEI